MTPRALGFTLVLIGGAMIVVGLLTTSGALSWFGHLPGDIRIRGEGYAFYAPIVSMLLISLALSLVLLLIRRLF